MNIDPKEYEKLAIETAIKAGQLIKALCAQDVSVDYKGPVDLVTSTDIASQELIMRELQRQAPDFGIIAEEGADLNPQTSCFWLVDPLDGTTNYAHGYPVYCVAIALMCERTPILGVVYDPNLDELFVGVAGEKPLLNGEPIKVSGTGDLSKSLLATGFPYDIRENPKPTLDLFNKFAVRAQGIRRAGAAALDLCALACGRIDGFWESGLKPWDTAAAGFIAELAGAVSSDYGNDTFDHFIPEALFSNGLIHDQMVEITR